MRSLSAARSGAAVAGVDFVSFSAFAVLSNCVRRLATSLRKLFADFSNASIRAAMKKGDKAFFYHSNEGKEIVGIAEIIKEAYPDPTDKTEKFVCVDIKADKPLKTPVTMVAIKAEKKLADMVGRSPKVQLVHLVGSG